jgi:hypothetical protein
MSEITTYMSRWNYNPDLSTFMTNHRLRNKNNTTDTTSGAGADYAFCEHEFIPVFLPFFTFFFTSVRLHYHLFSFVFFNVRFLFYFCFVVVLFACFCMLCFCFVYVLLFVCICYVFLFFPFLRAGGFVFVICIYFCKLVSLTLPVFEWDSFFSYL